jgi:murein DD-endopeptidase MepM/ murein hydrolase activator NlpD
MSRRRQPLSTRARGRAGAVAALTVALMLASLAILPSAAGSSGAGALAIVAAFDTQTYGGVAVSAATSDNTATTTAATLPTGLAATSTTASCLSFLVDRTLVSSAQATASGVDLLDGVVTADSVHVAAGASVLDGAAQATTSGSAVSGLHVAGVADADLPAEGQVTVPGVGTLTILDQRNEASGGEGSATAVGLSLTVTTATDGVPAQTTIVVGSVHVSADQASLDALLGTPSPSPTATPTPTPTPTPRPTHTATPHPSATLTPSATYPATTYTPMPAPATPSAEILARFPGAVFPVVGTYTYTDTFGAYRADMPNHMHEGDDIFASYGTPVVAVLDGTITGLSTTGIGGNNIHLTDARGDYFYYARLSRFATGLALGDHVVAGQTIGYVGDTGDARGTPPHLHFEIHPDGGAAIDPTPYLDAWRAAGHTVATGHNSLAAATTGATPAASDPAIAAAVQQAADAFAALQAGITSGSRQTPPRGGGIGLLGGALAVMNVGGALLLKRLQLAAVLLP